MKREMRISKTVEKHDGDWPPEDAKGFFAWFQAKIDEVPEASRSAVRIELGSTESYESSSETIEFSYVRPETDKEEAEREQLAAYAIARKQAAELRTLVKLQAKYSKPAA